MININTIYIIVPKELVTQEMINASIGGVVMENETHQLFKHEPPEIEVFSSFNNLNWSEMIERTKAWRLEV